MKTPTQQLSLIITFGENSWLVSKDGSWEIPPDDFIIPDDVIQYTVQLDDISIQGEQVFVFVNDYWLKVPREVVQANSPDREVALGENQLQTSSDESASQQGLNFFYQTVQRTGNELIAKSGFETTAAINQAIKEESSASVDTYAAITVDEAQVCSGTGEGEIYNLFGVVDDVEDGNTVYVTVTDIEGNSKTFVTSIINGSWSIPDADLSGLVDGLIIVTANTQDNNGNEASATTDFIKDTLAEITIEVDAGNDGIVNRFEASHLSISGTVTNVEDGQMVIITVTDNQGNSLEFTAIVENGLWQIELADISALGDGQLEYSAKVTDQSCNTATATINVEKDSQANINISVDTNADLSDNILNAAEIEHVDMSGEVNNVENDKTIKVFVSDGTQVLTFTTVVTNDVWSIDDNDLSSLNDGELTFAVGTLDDVGNLALNLTTVIKDTQAAIDIVIESGGDGFIVAGEVAALTISGTVTNVEAGQEVTIVLSNLFGDSNTLTAIVGDDLTWSTSIDITNYVDGQISADVSVSDIAGNIATNLNTAMVDRSDGIAMFVNTIEDKVDFTLNTEEVGQVNIFGLVNNVEDGQAITVTVTDGATLLTFNTTVDGYTWFISDADLSALDDGLLTYTANVIDEAGNVATDIAHTLKDTLAELTIGIDTSGDTSDLIINSTEASKVDIFGDVTGIENGQTVSVTVTDGISTLSFEALVNAGAWTIESSDLSSLEDGTLTFTATATDKAGNVATIENHSEKDSQAQINVLINSGVDEFLLASEISPVTITGSVTNIEAGQTVTIVLSNEAGDTDTLTAIVANDLTWTVSQDILHYSDGTLTADVSVNDVAGNIAIQTDTAIIDTSDGIAIFVNTFEDQVDTVVNAAEVNHVNISGIANNVEDGQTVTVTVTDGSSTLTYTTQVSGYIWHIPDNDLSSLADGPLTYTATVADLAGNVTTDSTTKIKDTQATISIFVDTNLEIADDTLSAFEAKRVDISGTVDNVENGQMVTVIVSDGSNELSFQAQVKNGNWLAENSDLSSLNDGTLTYTASVNDQAGNPTTSTTTSLKETQAQITLAIDTNVDVIDDVLNVNEISAATISGTVTGVEDGQTVTVIATDKSNFLYFTANVSGGLWSVTGADLSSFNDGELIIAAGVIDVVGNLAISSTNASIDTSAQINVHIESGDDEFLTSDEVDPVIISGTVTNVEAGQVVTVILSTKDGDTDTVEAIVAADLTWSLSLNISSYNDGTLTAQASVQDIAGNLATNNDDAVIDRADGIAIFVNTFADQVDTVINGKEADEVLISGIVNNVENGQVITVTVSDGINTLTFNTTVDGAVWSVGRQDLTSLQDGSLQFTATVTDVAGNAASDTTVKEKDTQALVTIVVDSDQDTTDNTINNVESLKVDVSGTVTHIEDEQTVTLTISDGVDTLTFTTQVVVGTWSIADIDISSLADGTVTYQVSTGDIAGNLATASTNLEKDTQASISVNIDSGDDEFLLASEINPLSITGTVNNVEAGNIISITLSNANGDFDTVTAEVQADFTYSTTVDVSGYADGLLTAKVSVTDIAGNIATNSDTATIDTTVFIDIDTGANGINIAELRANNISQFEGTTDAEVGQEVILTLSDGNISKEIFGVVDVAGHWLVTGVDIGGLAADENWKITASVTDLAGNTAIDDMPSIDVLRTSTIYEVIVALLGSHTDSETVDIDNADLAFSSDQSVLASLTSDGQNVTVALAADGQSLTVTRDGDSALVMTVEILLSQVKVKVYEAVDQPNNGNLLEVSALIEATQIDDDGTSETVTLPVYIDIYDAPPLAFRDYYTVIEDETSSGSLTSNDFTAEGPLKVTSITVEGQDYAIPDGGNSIINLSYGELTVSSDGFWQFVATDNLDNNLHQVFDLVYHILDNDGSTGRAKAFFTINDGQAGNMNDAEFTTQEYDTDESNVARFDFTIIAGSDTLLPNSIVFAEQVIDQLTSLGLTSNGIQLTYTSSDGKIINALSQGVPVFSLALSAVNNGDDLTATINFSQLRPLDHILDDNIILNLAVIAEDLDGTVINSGDITFTIEDGNDPQFSTIGNITLEEERLVAGPQFGTAEISTLVGSDNITEVIFANSAKQPELTANGQVIQYQISADGSMLTGYTSDINNPIFVAQIGTNFNPKNDTLDENYSFTLFQTLDQNISNDIPLQVIVKDYDGDSTKATLDITIIDDVSASLVTPDLLVSELPVDFSQATNIDLGNIISQSGTDTLVDLDYDVVNGSSVLDSNGNPLTQNGQIISWLNIGNGTLEAKLADGTIVFTVEVPNTFAQPPATNNVTFTLFGAVDHLASQSDSLFVNIPIALIDQDGSHIVDQMNVQIDDGLNPDINYIDAGAFLNEGDLVNNSSATGFAGMYDLAMGSDKIAAVTLTDNFNFSGVFTSNGDNVSLSAVPDANNWYIATADNDNSEVFRIRFNLDETYDYQQSQALRHPDGDDENILALLFDIQAVDADGDKSASQTVTVVVQDDVPTGTVIDAAFAEGDVINLDLLPQENEGADGAFITQVTYLGVDYTVDALNGVTFDLVDDQDAEKYAKITINADGNTVVNSNEFNYPDEHYLDQLTYLVTDKDNDTSVNVLNIDVRDNDGTIIAYDPTINEDDSVTLLLVANPGDIDLGESVTEIRINIASLNGGTLTLNGNPIPDDGTDYILSGALLIHADGLGVLAEGSATPNGDLVFTPLLNTSDAIDSQQVTIGVSTQIEEADTTKKPLIVSTIDVTINSVADMPVWDNGVSVFDYNPVLDGSIIEDGGSVALTLKADLFDSDGSEQLAFRIDNIDADLTLTYTDGGTKTVAEGSILTQTQLNTLLATSAENSAGLMTFEVIAIATEQDNSDTIEHGAKLVSINVQPVADAPELTVKNIYSDEDVAINVNEVISGQLSDIDGSETLSFELTLPTGWTLTGLNGAAVTDLGGGVWSALSSDIIADNVQIIPLADISSISGTFTIDVQAVAIDSITDGVPVQGGENRSDSKTLTVILQGVIDAPTMAASADWSFDANNLTITNTATHFEDNNVPLNFEIITSDDDGSEIISLTITGFPEGFSLVDGVGDDADLQVIGFESGLPVYSVTPSQLQALFVKPENDFSGKLNFQITAITTEPDGDSGEFPIVVEILLNPVVDENAASLNTSSVGLEDKPEVIHFKTLLSADDDGSELITAAVITSIPAGAILTLDGSEYFGSLDLNILATSLNLTLVQLLESDRLAMLPPEDASGFYQLGIDYTIVDTSDEGDSAPETFSTTIDITIDAEVDLFTRFVVPLAPLVSVDGSAIDLTGQIGFTDADIDGSEVLDYVVLILPDGDGWLVTHPNGAIPDGDGRWLIPIDNNLTSDSVQEANVDVLAGVTIISDNATAGPVTITVAGHVLDQTDQDAIYADFNVQFDVGAADSSASAVQTLQLSAIDGMEDQVVGFAGHLDNDIAGDGNDIISFRILAADLPPGVTLAGSDVQIMNDASGTRVFEYLFTQASIGSLTLSSAGEDYAGVLDIPIRIIATDSQSGDTFIDDSQLLQLDITPVVDGISLVNDTAMQEDVPESLDLEVNFLDLDVLPARGGQESILIDSDVNNNLTITLLDGGTLIDPTGLFVLKSGTTDTWQFTGTTQIQISTALELMSLQPVEHLAGDDVFRIQMSGSILDTALMLSGELAVSDTFAHVINIDVDAVTDPANLTTSYIEGDEDTSIDLSSLAAQLIDQDGSETLFLTIQGVPTGAVIATDADGNGVLLPVPVSNNGVDGGSFAGQPTFSWTVTPAQLTSLVLIPPLDFNGDIPLTLQAITKDEEPGQYITTSSDFVVGVNPIGDGANVFVEPDTSYEGHENEVVTIDLGAISTDTLGDEQIQIKVNIDASSDASALVHLFYRASIDVMGEKAHFLSDGSGGYVATLTIASNDVSSFDLHLGGLAWGTLHMSVDVATLDTAIVNGSTASDLSAPQSFTFDVELAPEADAPSWISYGDVLVTNPDNIALDLEIALQNPAPSEEGYLKVSGLGPGLSLSHGSQQGGDWIVDLVDVTNLSVVGASEGDNFDLILTPFSTLDNDTEEGATHIITVEVATGIDAAPKSIGQIVASQSQDQVWASNIKDEFLAEILTEMSNSTQGTEPW